MLLLAPFGRSAAIISHTLYLLYFCQFYFIIIIIIIIIIILFLMLSCKIDLSYYLCNILA